MNKVLDPEIRALLEEVARDPRARLLRVDDLHLPVREETPVGPAAARLTAAERELVEVHRHEVAQLLFEASRRLVYEHPTAVANLHHSATMDQQMELGDPAQWSRRAKRAVDWERRERRIGGAVAELERCESSPVQGDGAAVGLALASLRLVPRLEARMCVAWALMQNKQEAAGLQVAHAILGAGPSPLNESYAWEIVGFAEWNRDRLDAAALAYGNAAATRERRAMPLLASFAAALERVDRRSALEFASRLEEFVPPGHPSIDDFVRAYQSKRRTGAWRLSDQGEGLLRDLESLIPSVARSATRAFR